MRIFEYKVSIYVPDTENVGNSNHKGLCIINNDKLSNNEVKKQIIKKLFKNNKLAVVEKLSLIPILD